MLLTVVIVVVAVAVILLLGVTPAPSGTTTPPASSEQTTPKTTTPPITTPETSLAAQVAAGSALYCMGAMSGTTAEIWVEFPRWRMEGSFDGMESIIISEGSDVYMYMLDQWFFVDGAFMESIPSMDPTEEDVQTMLDNPDLSCQKLDDVADIQFQLPGGVTPVSLEEFITAASEATYTTA